MDKNDPGAVLIPFSGTFENKLLDMDDAERAKYLEENKVTRWVKFSIIRYVQITDFYAIQLNFKA